MMMDGSTMKEVPFLQHVAPISLLSNAAVTGRKSKSDAAATTSSSSSGAAVMDKKSRHYKVVSTDGSTSTNNVPRGAFGLFFCESSSTINSKNNEEGDGMTMMMASELASLGEYNKISNISSKSADEELPTIITDDDGTTSSEKTMLRGLSSTLYSNPDDTIICTHGVPGKHSGLLRITTRHVASSAAASAASSSSPKYNNDILLDISSLLDVNNNDDNLDYNESSRSSITEPSPEEKEVVTIVKTSCFITHPKSINNNDDNNEEDHVKGWSPTRSSSFSNNDENDVDGSKLHVHMMTSNGRMIRVVLSYPNLIPVGNNSSSSSLSSSFVYYPSYSSSSMSSSSLIISVGYDQVCFPTPTTVVFTTTNNGGSGGDCLYCIDLGDNPYQQQQDSSSSTSIITRVWSNIHKEVHDTSSSSKTEKENEDDGVVAPTPRKKARYSLLGNVLSSAYKMVLGGRDDIDEEYEYQDDNDDGFGGGEGEEGYNNDDDDGVKNVVMMSSITAVTSLNTTSSDSDSVARVATFHTDGTLRIWIGEVTRRKYNDSSIIATTTGRSYRPRLRIPSVQFIAQHAPSSTAVSAATKIHDGAICLRGQYNLEEQSYQIALYCNTSTTSTTTPHGGLLGLFRGKSFTNFDNVHDNDSSSASSLAVASFGNITVQELKLPMGCMDVVDISWDNDAELLLLFRQQQQGGDSVGVDVNGDLEGGGGSSCSTQVTLAVYPLNRNDETMYLDPVLPSNTTLRHLNLNHMSQSLCLSVSEELDRYMDMNIAQGGNDDDDSNDDIDMDNLNIPSSADIAQLEARIDKAGLVSIIQPMGRSRPSALAVYRAMYRLGLINTQDVKTMDDIHPAFIVLAMRNWKKRDEFSSALVVTRAGSPSKHVGTDHTKRHSNKSSRDIEEEDDDDDDTDDDIGDIVDSCKLKWIRLLSEIRLEESKLNEVVSISPVPLSSSPSMNVLVRAGMVSMLTLDSHAESTLKNGDEELIAGLDGIALQLIVAAMTDQDCRQLLNTTESFLYNAASKASSLVFGWNTNGKGNDLMVQIGNVGSLAMSKMTLTEDQLNSLSKVSTLDLSVAEKWLQSPTSLSSSVSNYLAITKTFATMPNSRSVGEVSCDTDVQLSTTSLISSMMESTRLLSLARLIVVSGMPHSVPVHIQQNALRSVLFSTALAWATKQPSTYDKSRTILDEYLSHEMTKAYYSSGVSTAVHLADMFIASSFSLLGNESLDNIELHLVSPSHEPRVALRLLAPLVEYPNFALLGNDKKNKEITAECLLAEAAVVAKQYDRGTTTTSPKELWSLASSFLVDSKSSESVDASNFTEIFECLKGNRESWWTFDTEPHHEELLYQALMVLLQIGDNDGENSSTPETDEEIQRLCTMQTVKSLFLPLALCSEGISVDQNFIDGNAWRNIPRVSMYNFVKTLMNVSNLICRISTMEKYLKAESGEKSLSSCCAVVLEAVNDAISLITSNLPHGMCREMPELSTLYSTAFQTSVRGRLWDEALQACISNSGGAFKDDDVKRLILEMVRVGDIGKLVDMSLTVVDSHVDLFDLATKVVEDAALEQGQTGIVSGDCPNYWGCLYALQASRGNWRQAAEAMDLCGKVTVSNALSKPDPRTMANSKKIMDQASFSAHGCSHALSLVEKSSRQYIGDRTDSILTKDDIDQRAARASALRALAMDECSPDSVSSILKSTSRDTIDILARMGYYEDAIAVAAGLSSKRRSNPSGVDVFYDSLRHILCTYLVPAALASNTAADEDDQLQSRSKIIQMRTASSICEQNAANSGPSALVSSTVSSHHSMQATMAMNLLHQYTTSYSKRCQGLGLSVASAIFKVSGGHAALPIWLKDLCMFGSSATGSNLFAQRNGSDSSVANPSGLIRLLIANHKYQDACDVVTAILSSQASRPNPSSRLPEKGSIDYVPYDLIDTLWDIIEVIASHSASETDMNQKKIQCLLKSRACMEKSLVRHFERCKLSEDGLLSARRLTSIN
jgi:hypothetical protein